MQKNMQTITDKFYGLPQDRSKYTDAQVEAILDFYVKLPLKELRQRQDFNNQYLEMLYAQEQREGYTERIRRAVRNIHVDEELLIEAVGRKTWPEKGPDQWHRSAAYIMEPFREEEAE